MRPSLPRHPTSRRSAAAQAMWLAVVAILLGKPSAAEAEPPSFEREVLPLLARNCLGCHGGLKQKAELDLRTLPSLHKGGESGPVVVPRAPDKSELWKKIAADKMPPGDKKLSPAEKQLVLDWIAAGLPTTAQSAAKEQPLLASGAKHSPAEVAAAIDQHLQHAASAAKLAPAPLADDAEFLRRAYLDLAGRIPTPEQAGEFLSSTAADKRARLIDALVMSPQFGEQLGRTWRDWICPPELPSDANGGKQPHNEAQALGRWLGGRIGEGETWDKITRELLTVDGETRNRPQAIFFGLAGEGGRITPNGSARSVASLFLGVQLQCAECHDDPYRAWSQKDFWSLAAFFQKTNGDFQKVSESPDSKGGKNKGDKNKSDTTAGSAQIAIPKTAFKNAGNVVSAAFLDGQAFGGAKEAPLRPQLVDWLVSRQNPYFARSFANRLWAYFFARGLVHPVDDFRELNPPSQPGLMQLLAAEFADSGYDIRHLTRCICNSQAYQRTSKPASRSETELAGLTAVYGRMPLRVMTADQLYDSLKLAYGDPKLDLRAIDPKDGNTNGESAPVGDAYLEFLRRFGTNKEDATDFTHGIPQLLAFLNHPRLQSGGKSLETYLKSHPAMESAEIVNWLYLSTLSRPPNEAEASEAAAFLSRAGDPAAGASGVLWMLVNRSEFLLIR